MFLHLHVFVMTRVFRSGVALPVLIARLRAMTIVKKLCILGKEL